MVFVVLAAVSKLFARKVSVRRRNTPPPSLSTGELGRAVRGDVAEARLIFAFLFCQSVLAKSEHLRRGVEGCGC